MWNHRRPQFSEEPRERLRGLFDSLSIQHQDHFATLVTQFPGAYMSDGVLIIPTGTSRRSAGRAQPDDLSGLERTVARMSPGPGKTDLELRVARLRRL